MGLSICADVRRGAAGCRLWLDGFFEMAALLQGRPSTCPYLCCVKWFPWPDEHVATMAACATTPIWAAFQAAGKSGDAWDAQRCLSMHRVVLFDFRFAGEWPRCLPWPATESNFMVVWVVAETNCQPVAH